MKRHALYPSDPFRKLLPAALGLVAVLIFAGQAARAEMQPAPGSTVPIDIKTCAECSTDYDRCVSDGGGLGQCVSDYVSCLQFLNCRIPSDIPLQSSRVTPSGAVLILQID